MTTMTDDRTRSLVARILAEHWKQRHMSAASTLYYDLDGNCHDRPGDDRIALSARSGYTLSEVTPLVQSLLGSIAEKNDAAPVRT